MFTQSTAVLHKYLSDKLKILCLLQFFRGCTEFPENSLSFPCSEISLSIPGFPDMWPPHETNVVYSRYVTQATCRTHSVTTWHWASQYPRLLILKLIPRSGWSASNPGGSEIFCGLIVFAAESVITENTGFDLACALETDSWSSESAWTEAWAAVSWRTESTVVVKGSEVSAVPAHTSILPCDFNASSHSLLYMHLSRNKE